MKLWTNCRWKSRKAIKSGAVGKIADVEDDNEQEKVEIYID